MSTAEVMNLVSGEVTCPICNERMDDPRMLKCLHTFCKTCLDGKVTDDAVTCPICEAVTDLPTGTEGLQVNRSLANIVDCLKKPGAPCGNCGETATIYCPSCQLSLCDTCSESIHALNAFKSHQLKPLTERKNYEGAKMCPTHPDEKLSLYCVADNTVVCAHCLLVGAHINHSCISLGEASAVIKDELMSSIVLLGEKETSLETTRRKIDDLLPQIETSLENLVDHIKQKMQELRDAVDAREEELVSRATQLKEGKVHRLTAQARGIDSILKQIRECNSAANRLVSELDDVDLLKLGDQIGNRLKSVVYLDCKTTPCDEGDFVTTFVDDTVQKVKSYGLITIKTTVHEFKYESDFDRNGLMWWLGTNNDTTPFRNPAETKQIILTCSSTGSGDVRDVTSRQQVVNFSTAQENTPWMQIDLGKIYKLKLSYYTIRGNSQGSLNNWKLLGSNDGDRWAVLKRHLHVTNRNVPNANNGVVVTQGGVHEGESKSWPVAECDEAFRYFRLRSTERNSYLDIGGIEFYGTLHVTEE